METPLWFRVYDRQLSFPDVLNLDNGLTDGQRHAVFLLSFHYGHSPYFDGKHLILDMFNGRELTDQSFCCFYMYILMGKSEKLFEGWDDVTTDNLSIEFPTSFQAERILKWNAMLLHGLFKFPPPCIEIGHYEPRNETMLEAATNQKEWLNKHRISTKRAVSVDDYYRLSIAHNHFLSTIEGVLGKRSLPQYLFQSVVYSFWPSLLRHFSSPSDDDKKTVAEAHNQLLDSGLYAFVDRYTTQLHSVFGDECPFDMNLKCESTPARDAARLSRVINDYTPMKRRAFTGRRLPVSDAWAEHIVQQVSIDGAEKTLTDILKTNRSRMEIPVNDTMLMGDPYWHYQCDVLLWHVEDMRVYVFLPQELAKLTERINPYTQTPLPDILFANIESETFFESILETWQRALGRTLDISLSP